MQFSIAAVALLASAVMAHKSPAAESTAYSTVQVTITSCHPTVTDCPARSTVTSASVITSVPSYANSSAPVVPTTAVPTVIETPAPVVPTPEVCVPETVTSTVTVTAPTGGVETPVSPPVVPTGGVPGVASPTASVPKNVTAPTSPPEFANGASGVKGSIAFAAVAGVAAFIFA
ncbi:uncharacterized protein BP5553_00687 [Venustampulla echinocandica]|uniref:GPI anchored serine-rich protein n=1 Tax=Venustampulla echinocandica TaxID=2656787 RepID=A0A370TYZ0_9HELO|nr:uncharacterized protein BP5553_00687 [Venustampulla echinocandica]RDL40708.1 hypothetical protein BP5553_00687 [Venustampulla echinocandica]